MRSQEVHKVILLRRGAIFDQLENDVVGSEIELGHREQSDDVHDDVHALFSRLNQLLFYIIRALAMHK